MLKLSYGVDSHFHLKKKKNFLFLDGNTDVCVHWVVHIVSVFDPLFISARCCLIAPWDTTNWHVLLQENNNIPQLVFLPLFQANLTAKKKILQYVFSAAWKQKPVGQELLFDVLCFYSVLATLFDPKHFYVSIDACMCNYVCSSLDSSAVSVYWPNNGLYSVHLYRAMLISKPNKSKAQTSLLPTYVDR